MKSARVEAQKHNSVKQNVPNSDADERKPTSSQWDQQKFPLEDKLPTYLPYLLDHLFYLEFPMDNLTRAYLRHTERKAYS